MIDAAPEYSLCSLAQLKERITVAKDNDDFDGALFDFAKLATQIIEGELGIQFKAKQYTHYVDTVRNFNWADDLSSFSRSAIQEQVRPVRIVLRAYPLAADASIDVRYDPTRTYADDTIIAPENYTLDAETGRLVLDYPVQTQTRGLRLVYTAGFNVDYDIPADGTEAQMALTDDADVSSNMIHAAADAVTVLFDGQADRDMTAGGSSEGQSAYVQWVFPDARHIASAKWYAPNDTTPGRSSGNIAACTLHLHGSISGTFSGMNDMVLIASRQFTGVHPGDALEIDAGANAVAYKGFRITMGAVGATHMYAAQVGARFKDQNRAYLRDVPSRLAMGAAIFAKYMWSKDRTGGIGFKTATERRSAQYASDAVMPNEVIEILQPYRRIRMV